MNDYATAAVKELNSSCDQQLGTIMENTNKLDELIRGIKMLKQYKLKSLQATGSITIYLESDEPVSKDAAKRLTALGWSETDTNEFTYYC